MCGAGGARAEFSCGHDETAEGEDRESGAGRALGGVLGDADHHDRPSECRDGPTDPQACLRPARRTGKVVRLGSIVVVYPQIACRGMAVARSPQHRPATSGGVGHRGVPSCLIESIAQVCQFALEPLIGIGGPLYRGRDALARPNAVRIRGEIVDGAAPELADHCLGERGQSPPPPPPPRPGPPRPAPAPPPPRPPPPPGGPASLCAVRRAGQV